MQGEFKPFRGLALDSIALLAVLTGLYPGLFFVSNNWFVLGAAQSVFLMASLVVATLVVLLTLYFLASHTSLPRRVARRALVVIALYLLYGYLDYIVADLEVRYDSFDVRGVILLAIAATAIFLLVTSRKPTAIDVVKPFNIGLCILSSLALFSMGLSAAAAYQKMHWKAAKVDSRMAIYDQVRLQSTPNIYLLIPDSYPSNRLLERFFHIDNSGFSGELQSLGFRMYDDYFSSYPSSIESVHSMLSMSHNYLQKSIGNDAIGLREAIASPENGVVKILSNNGYQSFFIHDSDYLFKQYCRIERCAPSLSAYDALRINLRNHHYFDWLPQTTARYAVHAEMKSQIAKTRENSKSFVYGHFMEVHSGLKSYDPQYERQIPSFRRSYPGMIAKMNRILLNYIREIESHDPSAVIIIVGDHGTWGGAERTETALTRDETLDKFNVFLAIRWGNAYKGEYDGDIKSGVNLFRYVFAYLSESEAILETRVPDESYFFHGEVYKAVQDGRVIENPQVYEPE